MNFEDDSTWRGVWAVTWRSVAYLPLMLAVFTLLLGLLGSLLMLPILGAACIFYGLWQHGVVAFAIWFVLLWIWRRFHLATFFEPPPSLL